MPNGTHGTKRAKSKAAAKTTEAKPYKHPESESPMRPEVGTQARFNKRLPAQKYRYDSSLSPAMDFDGQNPARPLGEWLLARIKEAAALPAPHVFKKPQEFKATDGSVVCTAAGLQDAVAQLAAIEKPFLNWAGKAERLSFDVPTLPLFIHERLSTKAIIETLKGHRIDKQESLFDLYADPQHPIFEQALRAYEHKDQWVNRMILGDSLVVMNSLLRYESLGGQVQMIYIDPPYGVKFGSNFQPFVRNRDVKHNDDEDMTREPEMVQAYRDTWELGLHSYLTYLRDRLLTARDLLHPSGSIFLQISDENVHHVRELMDEVFGADNFVAQVNFKSMQALGQSGLAKVYDYLLWYARDKERLKFRPLFAPKDIKDDKEYRFIDDSETELGYRRLSEDEFGELDDYAHVFRRSALTSSGYTPSCTFTFEFNGVKCKPFGTKSWRTNLEGIEVLKSEQRLFLLADTPYFKLYYRDFPLMSLENSWTEQAAAEARMYVVQTGAKFIQRCMLMTTDPGDLVLDPTCGSGTTAYVAEQWGRRWVTCDTSRVPLALARQRLLTATFSWYALTDNMRGPAGGFVYKRQQNKMGVEVGGIVPHVTLGSIANNEPPSEEIVVDRPETDNSITRVTGPFCVEATIPTALDSAEQQQAAPTMDDDTPYIVRMLEVLRRSPVLRVEGNKTVTLKNVRPPAKSLLLNAEAVVDATAPGQNPTLEDAVREAAEKSGKALPLSQRSVAFVFGPENAAVSQRLVDEAAREAPLKGYSHLYVIGFPPHPAHFYAERWEGEPLAFGQPLLEM
jgi:adenine-specific DNA-methyltransferase